jgi:hypothetical protein
VLTRVPIDIDRFEEGSNRDLRADGRTNAETILSFLAGSPEKAYTPKEIHGATGVARGSVGVVLSRLEDRELVRHRGEYWAVGDAEDVETTLTALAGSRALSERLGPEDPGEWGPGVESDAERTDE